MRSKLVTEYASSKPPNQPLLLRFSPSISPFSIHPHHPHHYSLYISPFYISPFLNHSLPQSKTGPTSKSRRLQISNWFEENGGGREEGRGEAGGGRKEGGGGGREGGGKGGSQRSGDRGEGDGERRSRWYFEADEGKVNEVRGVGKLWTFIGDYGS